MAGVRALIRKLAPSGSTAHWAFKGFINDPLLFPFAYIRSLLANYKLTNKIFPLMIRIEPNLRLNIKRENNSFISMTGVIHLISNAGGDEGSSIILGDSARLIICGDFDIGPGVHIIVSKDAELIIKGKSRSKASGITGNSRIMAEKYIEIGADCIFAWDVCITDSNWHEIRGNTRSAPVFIGDNVWVAHGVSILKGVTIPNGCIIGANSLVLHSKFIKNSLITGAPAKVSRTGVAWTR